MQNISFKGCIPVEFYAKHPITKKYVPIVQPQNINKCKHFVVRNLNRTLIETNQNDIFIKAYKSIDSDYAKNSIVRSYQDKSSPIPKTPSEARPYVYLFTGDDIDKVKELGKRLGKEKIAIAESTEQKEKRALRQASQRYKSGIKDLINSICPRVKDEKGNKLVMRVLFKPEYNSKGNLKNFEFQDVFFYASKDEYNL